MYLRIANLNLVEMNSLHKTLSSQTARSGLATFNKSRIKLESILLMLKLNFVLGQKKIRVSREEAQFIMPCFFFGFKTDFFFFISLESAPAPSYAQITIEMCEHYRNFVIQRKLSAKISFRSLVFCSCLDLNCFFNKYTENYFWWCNLTKL